MSRITFRTLLALFAVAMLATVPAIASAKRGSHHKSAKAKKVNKADRNRDGLPDRWERRHHLSLKVNQSGRDQDRDGANNAAEFAANTNPRDKDSDDDGVKDGSEDVIGTVVSFDSESGTLVISAGGLPVSGKVTGATEIKCEDEGDDEDGDNHRQRRRGRDDEGAKASSRGDSTEDDGVHQGRGTDDGPLHDVGDDHSKGGLPSEGGMPPAPGTPPAMSACTAKDLKPGAKVHEAQLKLTLDGPVWDEIELVKTVPAPPAAPAPPA